MCPQSRGLSLAGIPGRRCFRDYTINSEQIVAALQFARVEGIIPAPESAHAVKAALDEALRCKEEGKEEVIVFNLSGHGHFDMAAYDSYFAGDLVDYTYPEEKIAESLKTLPKVDQG